MKSPCPESEFLPGRPRCEDRPKRCQARPGTRFGRSLLTTQLRIQVVLRKAIFHPGDRCEDRPKRCQARPGAALAGRSLPLNCELSRLAESDFLPPLCYEDKVTRSQVKPGPRFGRSLPTTQLRIKSPCPESDFLPGRPRCEDRPKRLPGEAGAVSAGRSLSLNCELSRLAES